MSAIMSPFYGKIFSMENCSKCKINPRRALGQSYCANCHATYHRTYRKLHPEYDHISHMTPERCEKARIRAKARAEVRYCRLIKLNCQRCGAEKSEAHHPDYLKPLDVVWLCAPCHRFIHRQASP